MAQTWDYGPYADYVEIPTRIGTMGVRAGEVLTVGFDDEGGHIIERRPATAGQPLADTAAGHAAGLADIAAEASERAAAASARGATAVAEDDARNADRDERAAFVPELVELKGGWYEWYDYDGKKHRAQGRERAKAEAGII